MYVPVVYLLVLPGLCRISGHFRTNHGVARSWLTLGTTHEWRKYSWDTHGPPPKRRGAGAKKKVLYVPRTFVEVGRNHAISHKKWGSGFVCRIERHKMERYAAIVSPLHLLKGQGRWPTILYSTCRKMTQKWSNRPFLMQFRPPLAYTIE